MRLFKHLVPCSRSGDSGSKTDMQPNEDQRSCIDKKWAAERSPTCAPGIFLLATIAHQKSFEKALYAIKDNFPPGKPPGIERFANVYVNSSQGDGDMEGPWNSGDQWDRIDDLDKAMAMDGGDGTASVKLDPATTAVAKKLAARTQSDPATDPATGADLGAGPGAGMITGEDKGGAKNIKEAAELADAK